MLEEYTQSGEDASTGQAPMRSEAEMLAARLDFFNLVRGDMAEHPEKYGPEDHTQLEQQMNDLNRDISEANERLLSK